MHMDSWAHRQLGSPLCFRLVLYVVTQTVGRPLFEEHASDWERQTVALLNTEPLGDVNELG
jgi:hypothetical protein